MYIDKDDFHWFMGVKFCLAVLCFKMLSTWVAIGIIIVFSVYYRSVVAWVLGLQAMEIGDMTTFYTGPKAPTNIMSMTTLSACDTDEHAKELMLRMLKAHPKARSRIVKVLNDMYYEEMDPQECIET